MNRHVSTDSQPVGGRELIPHAAYPRGDVDAPLRFWRNKPNAVQCPNRPQYYPVTPKIPCSAGRRNPSSRHKSLKFQHNRSRALTRLAGFRQNSLLFSLFSGNSRWSAPLK
jgi:hypothetical protein